MAPDRPAPLGAYLAMAAGLLAMLSLVLPWFRFDEAAFAEAMQGVLRRVMASMGDDLGAADATSLQAIASSATDAASAKIKMLVETKLHGYQDDPVWVMLRLLTIAGAFAAALRIMKGQATGASQRGLLVGIGVALAIRPVMTLMSSPFDTPDTRQVGLEMAQIVPAGPGIYVALLAAALMVGAGLIAHLGDLPVEAELVEHSTPMPPGAPVPQAYMPGNPAQPGAVVAAAAYVPMQAQPAGAPGAYIPPQPQPAAAYPSAYQPATPAHAPNPAAYVPPQSAFTPPPVQAAQEPPRRSSGSVGPPGSA